MGTNANAIKKKVKDVSQVKYFNYYQKEYYITKYF